MIALNGRVRSTGTQAASVLGYAQVYLALMYEEGKGVPRNLDTALY